tara:strand:+ start:87 stop:284 length:198 start_codon:yes stop_codon:yes gene_type:complete
MSYKFSISDKGSNSKQSNSWSNAINCVIELAKANVGNVITVKCNRNLISESFVWCVEDNDIIPAY